MKVCGNCGLIKRFEDFYKHSGYDDGHLSTCKMCRRVAEAKRKAAPKENLPVRVHPNPKRYFGKLCAPHPELGGERLRSNYNCVKCHVDKRGILRDKSLMSEEKLEEAREKENSYRRNKRKTDLEYLERSRESRRKSNTKWRRENRYQLSGKRSRLCAKHTAPWADIDKIRELYREARKSGLTVDHIVPLIATSRKTKKIVACGLHVESNLQLLPASENFAKRHWFEPQFKDGTPCSAM